METKAMVLFTHDDLDGYGCKLVMDIYMEAIGNDDYEVIICANHNVDQKVMEALNSGKIGEHSLVVFTDISPSREIAEILSGKLKADEISGVMVYDHHETASWIVDVFPGDAKVIVSNELGELESGTSLLYQNIEDIIWQNDLNAATLLNGYNEKLLADVVMNIRSYDTYEWKISKNVNAKKLNILFNMIGGDNFVKKYFHRIVENDSCSELITASDLEFVDCKYNFEQSVIDKITTDDIIDVTIRGYHVALMVKSVAANISEVAYQFLEKHPEFDAFIQFSLFGGGTFSYRTRRDDLHVGRVFAAPVGGGGHPKASGSQLPDFIKNALQEILIKWLNGDNLEVSVSTIYNRES